MKALTKLDYNDQYKMVESFIVHNTNEEEVPLNYKMTSQTWAELVSKWAGVEISPKVVIDVCKEFAIDNREICKGVFVFAMTVNKLK